MGDIKWSRPAGLKLARENLQSRVKEKDSITDVENAVFDFKVMDSLSFLLSEGQTLHASRPSRLCAQAQSVDDMPFRKQACTEYTRWVFYCGLIESGVKHLLGSVVHAMMSPGRSIVASLENVYGFLAVNTPPDDLIRIDFKQKGVAPKVMLYIFEEFVLLLGRHSLNNEIPRMVVCKVGKPWDFLTDDRSSNLYTIALNEVESNSSTCLLAKAFSTQSWLWHQRLSHVNFATINNLVKNNLVQGLPKMIFEKDHLCSACEQGKIHRKHHKSKTAFASNKPLYLLHMDLCGPMSIESINGKRYVLVVVNDYSRYTWTSTSHNVFNERLEDAYFDASTSFHDPSNVHTFYQPYPHEKKWTKDHPLHKIIGDPKSSVRTRGQLANSCLLSSIEPAGVEHHYMVFHLVIGVHPNCVEMICEMDFVRYVIQEIHASMILIRILSIALPILATLHTPHTRLTRVIHMEMILILVMIIDQEQAAKSSKILACCDDDDDYAITPNEPVDSLSMGDEHLNTISVMKSDEFIKSCVENLVPNPSKSEGENGCDVPACFTTFSNILFDADYETDSSDYQSCSDEEFSEELYSNPLFKEEIIPMKIDQHHFDVESDLIKSMLNRDSSIIPSSSKIDSLLDEFADGLILLKSISPGIDKTDCYYEEGIHLIERLLYDNPSPHPPKEFVSENSDADNESFSPSPIPDEDSDSRMEEIDLSYTLDDPMPPSIKDDDNDSERDILILEELPSNYSLSLPEIESFYFDIPSFARPPAKPPDANTRILNIKMMGDVSDQKVPIPRLTITLVSNQEKSLDLLSHRGVEIFQLYSKCPMMIHGKNIPILDVPLFHFYLP
nr:ribonuclease H-like domain-containing protein [Tanacetum cinerariifolium]